MGWLDAPRRWALGLWCGGLLLSAAAGWWAHGAQQARIAERLQTATTEIAQRIDERFRQYEFGLRGARGAVVAAGGEAISRGPFEAYVATRDLAAEFPGARGFGFIRRVGRDALSTFETAARIEGPFDFRVREIGPHEGDHFVIQYIYPLSENAGASGLDIASEVTRRDAAVASAREGRARLTAPITLVQASGLSRRGLLKVGLDDIAVLAWVMKTLDGDLSAFRAWREAQRPEKLAVVERLPDTPEQLKLQKPKKT